MKQKFLLVDADIPIYRFSCVNETKITWDKDNESLLCDLEKAKVGITTFVEQLIHKTKCTDVIMCVSSDRNFRYTVLPSYKTNRQNKEEPELRQKLKEFVLDAFDSRVVVQLEADDVLGILATREDNTGTRYVMASIDKDLKQIPGTLYNWDTNTYTTTTEVGGKFWHYYQTLCGDSVDGYGGCPGIGAKKAQQCLFKFFDPSTYKLNEDEAAVWEAVVELYASKGLSEGDAITQARVAKILTANDYDFKRKRPVLWLPPSYKTF